MKLLSVPLLLITATGLMPLSALHAETPETLRQTHLQRCAKPVFYAQTASHKKEVEICIITPSLNQKAFED